MRFTPSFLDEIRARLPVSSVVGRRVRLKKRGREFVGLSPFNREKTPSFTVNDQKGFYHCFSSGKHGDIFRFLMETEGLGFAEAVERLANEAGVPLPARDPRAEERERERDDLHAVMDRAAAFFRQALETSDGAAARGYLSDRGVSATVQENFGIGYAPNSRSALRSHLESAGISREAMVKTGLLIDGDDIPVAYDRFRDRIVFPIADLRGRTVGFGGRALSSDVPAKYLNSPETPLFHKGTMLYNAHRARPAIHGGAALVVAEGYMDVIALSAAGFGGAVAPLGTALTEDQLGLLWRMADEPILCFDGDRAGLAAAYRAIDLALSHLRPGKSLRFALLPDGLDPDDVIKRQGPGAMQDILDKAQPLIELLWMREFEAGEWTTPERRAAFESRIGALVRDIRDEAVRRHYRDAFDARLTGLRGDRRRKANGRKGDRRRAGGPPVSTVAPVADTLKSRRVKATGLQASEREALILLGGINHPDLIDRHTEMFADLEFSDSRLSELRDLIIEACADPDAPPLAGRDDDAVADRIAAVKRIVTHHSYWWLDPDTGLDDAEFAWMQIVTFHHREVTLHRELKVAERALSEEWTEESFERLRAINAQIRSLAGTEALSDDFGLSSGRKVKSV